MLVNTDKQIALVNTMVFVTGFITKKKESVAFVKLLKLDGNIENVICNFFLNDKKSLVEFHVLLLIFVLKFSETSRFYPTEYWGINIR